MTQKSTQSKVAPCPLPQTALLQTYAKDPASFTDCFAVDVAGDISLGDFVTAFYTTPIFRVERFILRIAARRPSTDADARAVARATQDDFAVWTVETRAPKQMLLKTPGRTRSWFMTETISMNPPHTRLYFGSAVVPPRKSPKPKSTAEKPALGGLFAAFQGLHEFYSRALLSAAQGRLGKSSSRN